MTANSSGYEWHGIGASVRGASHKRANIPNQDAICWDPESKTGVPLILAISDGHGSAKYFRSHHGADIAVHVAATTLQRLIQDQTPTMNLTEVRQIAEGRLPQSLLRNWRAGVDEHVQQHPFTNEEREKIIAVDGVTTWEAIERNKYLAYGATLLSVLVTDQFILYVQLGDGDILIVDSVGETTRPFTHDERLMANETTSLCSSNAANEIQVKLVPMEVPPEMVVVATDGYANSFPSEDGFRKLGTDYLQMIKTYGKAEVQKNLDRFLWLATRDGSGDDITVGIIKRVSETDFDTQKRNHAQLKQQVAKDHTELKQRIAELEQELDRLRHLSDKQQQALTEETRARQAREDQLESLLSTKANSADMQQALAQQDSARVELYQELLTAVAEKANQTEVLHLIAQEISTREQAMAQIQTVLDSTVSHAEIEPMFVAEVDARTNLRAELEAALSNKVDQSNLELLIREEMKNLGSEDLKAWVGRLKLGVILSILIAIIAIAMTLPVFLQYLGV